MAVPVTDMIVSTAEDGVVAETTSIKDPNLAMAQSGVNNVLLEIISRFSGATYAGVATPETEPGKPLLKVFYLTTTAGEYANFGNITVESGKLTVLLYNGSTWEKQVLDLPASGGGGGTSVTVVQEKGDSTTDVMSQDAVTRELNALDVLINGSPEITQPTEEDVHNLNINSVGGWSITPGTYCILLDVSYLKSAKIKITNYSNSTYAFLVDDSYAAGGTPDYCEGFDHRQTYTGQELTVPSDANYLYFAMDTRQTMPILELTTAADGLAQTKQDKLVSGDNIKTINGETLLGAGDLDIGLANRLSSNLINLDEAVDGYISPTTGEVKGTGYKTTGFIAVTEGNIVAFSYMPSGKSLPMNVKFLAAYSSGKEIVSSAGMSANAMYYKVPSGVSYIRFSWNTTSYSANVKAEITENFNSGDYESYYKEVGFSASKLIRKPIRCFLPRYIYVAVGRTIELYNSQVCVDCEGYYFQWICDYGTAMSRKFTITGTEAMAAAKGDSTLSVGQHRLTLNLFDRFGNMCWTGQTILCVHAASAAGRILPIGDSLTNWKRWLPEVMKLSGDDISFVGTRYSGVDYDSGGKTYDEGTIHHEGRSGFSAADYLTNSSYSFDTRYDGVPDVEGSANPFFDGEKFSLAHYLTSQSIETPSAVQIFLGTNDISNSVSDAVANIKAMVDSIVSEYPDMLIFLCHTIYRSGQNGYGSIGSDGYSGGSGARAYQYDEDCKVFDLMVGLTKELIEYSNVVFVPLATCHDREYNFGAVEVAANPRAEQKISVPVESVHPQAQGYYQFADVMFSAYCWLLDN